MIFFIYILSFLNAFEIVKQSENISVCSGEQIEVYVLANEENLEYRWFKDENKIDFHTSSIIFENVNSAISGNYYCEIIDINSNQSVKSNLITINIKNKSEILNKNNEIILFENQVVNLKCEVNDLFENENSYFKWYDKDWNLISDDSNTSGSNSNLLSINTLNNSFNKVFCIFYGDCGIDTAEFTFQFYNILTPQLQKNTICEDYEINYLFEIFETRFLDLPKNYKLKIYNEKGIVLKSFTTYKNNVIEFEINDIMTYEKTGIYKCDIEFNGKTISFNLLDLSIYQNTELFNKNEDFMSFKEGERIVLFIEAKGNIQSYIWLKDGLPVDTTKYPTLYINNSRKEDSGIYSCTVKNFCKDSTFFISEVEVIENAVYLSKIDIENNISDIEYLVDLYGNIYYISERNQFRNIKSGLYIIKYFDNSIKKYYKYE